MAGINKVILVGNLGKDPEVRHLENGATVANFPLATSETYTDRNGERITQTEWHNIVLWRKTAEIAERYLRKGRQVYIEGKIRTRNWTDRDGNQRYTTEIVGDVLQLLGSREEGSSGPSNMSAHPTQAATGHSEPSQQKPLPAQTPEEKDDLPF